ncbi:hypothetical protein P3X46_010611 [Hevea brasiliensis]|uniref:Uncharacterized protein n=1 Tax=Hevea brasiliensis TaxID=3981 RepID=A0ABQ9MEM2_HEVBR|nr:uncharacterized protein At5g23160 [Hevea brasiliensis]KAJ9178754.1 hypothetical protein P3X46_010611 [Hevea brasiliensis]
MDEKQQPKPKAKTTLYLGCFGFSGKLHVSKKKTVKIVQTVHKHNWFSRSTTFLLKQSGIKTLRVDYSTISERLQTRKTNLRNSKPKLKPSDEIPSKRKNPAAQNKIPAAPEVDTASDQATEDRPQETKHGSEQSIILEDGKLLDPVMDSSKQLSFSRKIDSARVSSSQPSSPEHRSHGTAVLRSTSLPAPNPRGKSRVSAKRVRKENGAIDKKFDPVIGMSIVMVTLIIMLLLGRFCAILCTCAWLYFFPRLTAEVKPSLNGTVKNGLVSSEPDFNSEEYKKRVVLEGFLDRNHRSPS